MKKNLLFALAILMASCGGQNSQEKPENLVSAMPAETAETTVQAASERDGYTFSTTFRKNEDDQCDAIILTCQKGEKSQEFASELVWPKDEDILRSETAGDVIEEDINFDGVPDVVVYLGDYSVLSTIEFYAACVWDEASQSFKLVEKYEGIPNPVIDAEKKVIISNYMDLSDNVIEDVYRWVDGELVPITE